MDIGGRIRELRLARGVGVADFGFSRGMLWKIENNGVYPSLHALERVCEALDVGFERLLGPQERFQDLLMLEDPFVEGVRQYLKQLDAGQKEYILKVLDAAPKQPPQSKGGRPRSVRTARAISSASRNCTEGRVSATFFQTSPIQSLPLAVSRKTVKRSALHS